MATRRVININSINLGGVRESASPNETLPQNISLGNLSVSGSVSLQSVPNSNNQNVIKPFGNYQNKIDSYPNDVVRLDIENANAQFLESNFRVNTYILNGSEVTLDPEKDLADLSYISGKYGVTYRFHRNLLGSGDGHKLQIQEISSNGLEIRVIPALSSDLDNTNFLQNFSTDFWQLPKPQTLPNLFLFKDSTTFVRVFDYVQDKFTYPTTPYSIVFKLTTPLPVGIVVGDFLWLSQQVSDDLVDSITIIPPKVKANQTIIAGPNWDVLTKSQTAVSTQYRDWDDLLSTNTQTAQDIVNTLLSSSFLEGVPLNIDYRQFENFTQFGSAAERLLNFKYKVQLIESYDARINSLTSDLTGLISGSASGSTYYLANVNDTKAKKAALLGSFDGYEKYLYYESSSYESSSYGEFYPTTWPKSTSTKPYTLYSYTSSQAEEWFDGILSSASLYDQNNEKALYRTIPAHVLEDPSNEGYVLFTNMIGHYFDLMFAYIKHMSKLYNREESLVQGFSKELVYHVAKNLGLDFENGTSLEELWSYTLGTDVSGSISSTYEITTQDKTKEIWKRIINNLPYLLKTKGTERGVRALINCFGIPQTILRIREYGGVEPDFDTKTDYVYERFNYSTTVGYNGAVSGQAAQLVAVPWLSISGSQGVLKPLTIELRAKMAPNQTKVQRLIESTGSWYIEASQSGNFQYLNFKLKASGSSVWASTSVSCSIYDSGWHLIALRRESETDVSGSNQTYTLITKRTNYEKVVESVSASLYVPSVSSSYNASFVLSSGVNSQLWIPGTGSFSPSVSHSMGLWSGSIQELRYWAVSLDNDILDNHALAPTSYQSNTDGVTAGSTSSFYDLGYRITFGSDNKKYNVIATQSLSSSHPNQSIQYPPTNFYNFTSSYYKPNVEIQSLEWPDLGTNRSVSNKIRIDETFLAGTGQLRRDASVVRSLTDQYPIDNPRLGIYFSPTNEVNKDIAEQFGGISIDDFIGDPSYLTQDNYPGLEALKQEYFKKFTTARNRAQNYIRLIKHFDSALFQLIKKFVPYRANTQVGLVVEPHVLSRSKMPVKLPDFEEMFYSTSIDLGSENFINAGGGISDGGGDPHRNLDGYVQEATIGNEVYPMLPVQDYDSVILDQNTFCVTSSFKNSALNLYNNTQINDNPTSQDSLTGEVNLGVSGYGRNTRLYGSQYVFTSYARSGSGWIPFTSSRYDYYEALNPVLMDSSYSECANRAGLYSEDIYGGNAFKSSNPLLNTPTIYSSSDAINLNGWSANYGLQIVDLSVNGVLQSTPFSTSYWWNISGSALSFDNGGTNATSSIRIPAFFYEDNQTNTQNLWYNISIKAYSDDATNHSITLFFGDTNSPLSLSIPLSTTPTTYNVVTKATGNWLGIKAYSATDSIYINRLEVACLNYRAQVQDYHLRSSYGMRTVRYDGSKLSSADWNVNSQDTIDGGPVVEVTTGGGKQLAVKPNVRGNFEVR